MKSKLLMILVLLFATVAFAQEDTTTKAAKTAKQATKAAKATKAQKAAKAQKSPAGKIKVAMVPKLKGIDYFNASEKGAKEAAQELGIELIYDGPVENQVERQIEMIDTFVVQGVDVIAVAPNDPVAIAPALKKAIEKGIHVITWDADSEEGSREWFVNQATYEGIGGALVDVMARVVGPSAKTAIVTGSLTASNQNVWMEKMREKIAQTYPQMTILDVKASEEDQQLAYKVTQDLIKAYPDLQGVFGITSVSLPGAAEAVKNANLTGKVAVTGLSTPDSMRDLVKAGVVKAFVLWDPADLGYLTIQVAKQVAEGTLKPGATIVEAGRLGSKEIRGTEIILGPPLEFTAENIDNYHF